MRRRSGLMAVSVMRCSCLNGGWQSPILRQDAAGLEAARILSPSKARALESKAAPGPGAFYRVSGFVLWHNPVHPRGADSTPKTRLGFVAFMTPRCVGSDPSSGSRHHWVEYTGWHARGKGLRRRRWTADHPDLVKASWASCQ